MPSQSSSIIIIILFSATFTDSSTVNKSADRRLENTFNFLDFKCNHYNLTNLSVFERKFCNIHKTTKPYKNTLPSPLPWVTIPRKPRKIETDTFFGKLECVLMIFGVVYLLWRLWECIWGFVKLPDNQVIQEERNRLHATNNLINHNPTYQSARIVIPTECLLPQTSNAFETTALISIPSEPIIPRINFEGPSPIHTLATCQLGSPPRYCDPEEPPPEYPAPPTYSECIEKE
ncbi:unnamed protein product [Orchesella dallaii]|uniref:Uncharacterized protein n=1 Tax=Orchesella dallaii TaxID=48710 RepID=A0ABP1S8C3_9HEXA